MSQEVVALDDLVDLAEIARRRGVHRGSIRKLKSRLGSAWPEPVLKLTIGDVYSYAEVTAFLDARSRRLEDTMSAASKAVQDAG